MRLLVCAQTVDSEDRTLGFFVEWLREFEKAFGTLNIIALGVGAHDLASRVHSLGKERGAQGRLRYAIRGLRTAWALRNEYDTVFVHMNQEYVLLAGWLWKLMGKKVYLWRNHYAGGIATDIASLFCDKIFCTSKFSYTAKYKKTVLMPVGVSPMFKPQPVTRTSRSILFFGRFAKSKRPHVLVDALGLLQEQNVPFTASFYGDALQSEGAYREHLLEHLRADGLSRQVSFESGVPHTDAPRVFSSYEVFVDPSESGMYNKTIFEAAACGALVLAVSKDFAEEVGAQFSFDGSAEGLAKKLQEFLALSEEERGSLLNILGQVATRHSLSSLVRALATELH